MLTEFKFEYLRRTLVHFIGLEKMYFFLVICVQNFVKILVLGRETENPFIYLVTVSYKLKIDYLFPGRKTFDLAKKTEYALTRLR